MVRLAVIPSCAAIGLCLWGMGIGLLLPLPVAADNYSPHTLTSNTRHPLSKVHYHIERQLLATALTLYAEQSNLQILFRTQGIPAIDVGPLEGTFDPREAIALLLEKTGLDYSFGAGDVVVIFQPPEEKDNPPAVAVETGTGAAEGEIVAAEPTVEEVWVTGIRGSLQRNLLQKHLANAVVDVITSEDVGKFPDKNIADALQRIPGVSVDRIWGEGRDINIRGTDKDINRTLMNGQNVASAYWWANDNPGRGFNYTMLASELIASLAVYKSPEADIDEGSIGGTVIIYTHKPFDMESNRLNMTLEGQYSELPDVWNPQFSALGSWKNSEETFGVLASLNWQNRNMRRDGLEAFPDNSLYSIVNEQGQVTEDVYVIWGGGSAIFQEERERKTNNLTVQWAPYDNWDLAFNYVESSLDMDNSNQNFLFMPGGFKLRESPPVVVSNPRFGLTGDGRQTLLGGVMGNPDSPGAVLDAIFRDVYLRTAVYDLDINYRGDNWLLHTQLGTTAAEGGSDHDRLYRFLGNTREEFSLTRDSIEVEYLDLDPENAASLAEFSSESHDWIRKMEDEETYAQLDYKREFTHGVISAFKTGIKWRNQTIENNRTIGSINTNHSDWPAVQAIGLDQVSSGLTPPLHRQTATSGSLTRFAWADESLLRQVISPYLDSGLLEYQYDANAFYQVEEDISAAYVKADFSNEGSSGKKWRGNLGLRIANTQQTSLAYQDILLHYSRRRYTDYLPSANLAYDINKNLVWRSSLARVMARPTFPHLSSNIVIDGTSGTASSGNPNLAPFRAKQLDTGLEWYFNRTSILSANYFYKSVSTYIYHQTMAEMVDSELLSVTRPYNAEGAKISGLELQWQQDFGGGFGWLSNYTYTHARVPSQDKQQLLKLPGNSRDQINSSFYYETPQFSIRISHNYRSTAYGELISGTQDETRSYRQWDLNCSWSWRQDMSVFAEAINLTNEPIYYRTANEIPQGLYENGRRFAIGTRLKF